MRIAGRMLDAFDFLCALPLLIFRQRARSADSVTVGRREVDIVRVRTQQLLSVILSSGIVDKRSGRELGASVRLPC